MEGGLPAAEGFRLKQIKTFLKRTAAAFGVAAGIPVTAGLLMSLAEDWSSAMAYRAFGWLGVVLTGLVGTPVHEAGHDLACRIFRLTVTEVSLFRPVAGRTDGILGYVRFSYDPTDPWQRLAAFGAGIMPMFFGIAVILMVVWLLTPEVWDSCAASLSAALRKRHNPLRLVGALISGYLKGFGSLRRFGIVRGMVSLYLAGSVSMHLSLSTADLRGLPAGLLAIFLLCAVYALGTLLFRVDAQRQLAKAAAVLTVFFSLGLLLCLLFGLLARLALIRF